MSGGRGLVAMTRAEIRLFRREPFSLVFVLAFPLMMMLLLSAVFGNDESTVNDMENGMLVWRGGTPTDYYTSASIASIVSALGLMTLPINLSGYREQGVLRRLRASSVPPMAVFGAQLTVALLATLGGAALLGLVAWLAYDALLPQEVLGVGVALVVATVAFGALGVLLAAVAGSSRSAQGIGLLLFFGMWLVGGTGPPVAVLPSGLREVTRFLPLTRAVTAVQDPWLGAGWAWGDLGYLAGLAAVAGVLALWRFRWD